MGGTRIFFFSATFGQYNLSQIVLNFLDWVEDPKIKQTFCIYISQYLIKKKLSANTLGLGPEKNPA